LLLCGSGRRRTVSASAASAAAASPARALLALGPRLLLLLLLLLRRTRLLRRRAARLLLSALPLAIALALLLARLLRTFSAAARPFVARRTLFAWGDAGSLLELAHFLVHVPPGLLFLAVAQLVMPAIRAALPSLGIGAFAGRAKDAFRQRHRKSARIVHFGYG
jgi:hypothetical protein